MNELLEAALSYAEMGLAVFPLHERDKTPITAHGFEDASTEERQIRLWWKHNPSANIGIATGQKSGGLVVVDMDVDKDEGKDGYHTFKEWCAENYLVLPDSWMSITGRGGYHLFYKSDGKVPSKIGWLEDVDIRADGGYVVAPPSIHPNGTRYEWEQPPDEYELIGSEDMDVQFIFDSVEASTRKEKSERLNVPQVIPQGHRDEMMFKLACKYQQIGMTDEAMLAALMAENQARCQPPLTEKEIRKKVEQAQKYDKGETITAGEGNKARSYGRTNKNIEETITEEDLDMPTLDEFEEREKEWLIPGYIPSGCVTLLCSDGGIGKTSLWCDTLAALTTGRTTIFDKALENPFHTGLTHTVMYFSKEDPTEEVLKRKLRLAGADPKKIRCFGLDDPRLTRIKYNTLYLEKLIEKFKPDIVVFDTLQAFLPDGVEMSKRKDMRDALEPLNQMGARLNTTFLLIMHTNKSNSSGRQRMADSSDIWDLGRSALMAGRTQDEDVCYLSHEKSNYGKLQKTILFSLSDEGVEFKGTSRRKDRDYMADNISTPAPTPRLDEAIDFILENVTEEGIEVAELERTAKAAGIAQETLKNARAQLKKDNRILVKSRGFGETKKWYVSITPENDNTIS